MRRQAVARRFLGLFRRESALVTNVRSNQETHAPYSTRDTPSRRFLAGRNHFPDPTLPLTEALMNNHYRDSRKIDPTRGAMLGDGTPNDADRVEIGPTALAFAEWEAAGLELPDLPAMRRYRWERLVSHVIERDLGEC